MGAEQAEAFAQRAKQGDGEAFGLLVDPFLMRLLMFIRFRGGRLLGSDVGAEDVLQDALTRAWKLVPRFEYRGPEALYRWLVALADGVLADRVKYLNAKGRGAVRHVESNPGGAARAFDSATSVSKVVARKLEYERATHALESLDEKQRAVVERHLLHAMSLSQIAGELGISKNAVWERLHRAMAKLKVAMS